MAVPALVPSLTAISMPASALLNSWALKNAWPFRPRNPDQKLTAPKAVSEALVGWSAHSWSGPPVSWNAAQIVPSTRSMRFRTPVVIPVGPAVASRAPVPAAVPSLLQNSVP